MKQGSKELEGKVALVTGAGSGIGKAPPSSSPARAPWWER